MDDKTAIGKCLKGESEAFRYLVEGYQSQATVHAAAILGNIEDAKDAVQDAFVDAYRGLSGFDMNRRFYPWLYVLLRNRCFKQLGARRTAEDIDEVTILAPQSGVPAEERIGLERALMKLSADEREIITLKYLDGLSYREIAEYLEIPRGTVMSRLFYARRRMEEILEARR